MTNYLAELGLLKESLESKSSGDYLKLKESNEIQIDCNGPFLFKQESIRLVDSEGKIITSLPLNGQTDLLAGSNLERHTDYVVRAATADSEIGFLALNKTIRKFVLDLLEDGEDLAVQKLIIKKKGTGLQTEYSVRAKEVSERAKTGLEFSKLNRELNPELIKLVGALANADLSAVDLDATKTKIKELSKRAS